MTNEELNTKLYEKMFEEQEQYRYWLLSQPQNEIISHCYEFTMREDILLSLECNDLESGQAKALLRSPCPLADVYKDWEKRDSSHMEEIWDTITSRADTALANQRSKKKEDFGR